MRVCLVSPELHPLPGGGLGVSTAGTAAALADAGAEVSVLVGGSGGAALARALAADASWGDPRIRLLAAPAPEDWNLAGFTCAAHAAAGAVLERFAAAFAGEPPDLVQVADYLGLGAVLLQARAAGHPALLGTRIVTRVAGAAELTGLHDGHAPAHSWNQALWTLERCASPIACCGPAATC